VGVAGAMSRKGTTRAIEPRTLNSLASNDLTDSIELGIAQNCLAECQSCCKPHPARTARRTSGTAIFPAQAVVRTLVPFPARVLPTTITTRIKFSCR